MLAVATYVRRLTALEKPTVGNFSGKAAEADVRRFFSSLPRILPLPHLKREDPKTILLGGWVGRGGEKEARNNNARSTLRRVRHLGYCDRDRFSF